MTKEVIGSTKNIDNATDWHQDGVSFAEQYDFHERFSLSYYEAYDGLGAVGVTDFLHLSNSDVVMFVESVTPVPERMPSYTPGGISTPGNPAYESRSASALLFDKDGSLIGYASSGSRIDEAQYSIDTFAFNVELVSLLPEDIAAVVEYINSKDKVLGLKIDEAYRRQGKAEEVLLLLLAYLQNNSGAKTVEVGTDSTISVDSDTGEITSFYKRTGATGPKNDKGGWKYDVDAIVRERSAMLVGLMG